MNPRIIDASVAIKLIVNEPDSAQAESVFRTPNSRCMAPTLLMIELASVLWKRFRRGDMDRPTTLAAFDQARHLPLELLDVDDLLPSALELAITTDRTVYDCLYIAAAIAQTATLITADDRLVNSLSTGPLARHIRALSTFAA